MLANVDLVYTKGEFIGNKCNLVTVISIDLRGRIPRVQRSIIAERMAYIPNHALFYLLEGEERFVLRSAETMYART